MSVVRQYTINCDATPNDHTRDQLGRSTCPGWVATEYTLTDARKLAHRLGWKRVGQNDYCPDAAKHLKVTE